MMNVWIVWVFVRRLSMHMPVSLGYPAYQKSAPHAQL